MTSTAVRIWCPDWRTVPEQTHLDDLENWEGCVIHSSDDFEAFAARTTRLR